MVDRVPELSLSRIWNARQFASEMRTTDGRRLSVIYGGVWTHQTGPDFRDALLEIDGRLVKGSVELHLREGDWFNHGHHLDPAYNDVRLHVVLDAEPDKPCRTVEGNQPPTVWIRQYLPDSLPGLSTISATVELGAIGSRPCLPTLVARHPDVVRTVLREKGWERVTAKQLRISQEFELHPPGAVLYLTLLDALGLMENRDQMAQMAELVPLQLLEGTIAADPDYALALVLGAAGFLPLTEIHAAMLQLDGRRLQIVENAYGELLSSGLIERHRAPAWSLRRVRPANHPLVRLASLVDLLLLAGPIGLLSQVLIGATDRSSWLSWLDSVQPRIGTSRRDQIIINAFAPFVAAFADYTNDDLLGEVVSALWEQLPGSVDDRIAKDTLKQIAGDQPLRIRHALEVQGLHQIGRFGCRELRCFECPIAILALQHERSAGVI